MAVRAPVDIGELPSIFRELIMNRNPKIDVVLSSSYVNRPREFLNLHNGFTVIP
jgi:hypothetical protein